MRKQKYSKEEQQSLKVFLKNKTRLQTPFYLTAESIPLTTTQYTASKIQLPSTFTNIYYIVIGYQSHTDKALLAL